MNEYHKIYNFFKRDATTKKIINEWGLPEYDYLQYCKWQYSEKIDGMNIRIVYKDNKFNYLGKTNKAIIPNDLLCVLKAIFEPKIDLIKEMFGDKEVCFFGEGFGKGIQEPMGTLYSQDKSFILFDIKINELYLTSSNMTTIAKELCIRTVHFYENKTLYELIFDSIDKIKNGQRIFTSAFGDFEAEGIVAKPELDLRVRTGQRIITKIKYRDLKDLALKNQ